jgi:hypothetical protein
MVAMTEVLLLGWIEVDGSRQLHLIRRDHDNDWIHWRPIRKDRTTDHGAVERRFGAAFHPSVHEYFNAYWFLALGGHHERRALELTPVVPGAELDDFTQQLEAAVRDRGAAWPWTPLGIETNTGFPVVVSATDGSVALWNFEIESLEPVAADLGSLIRALG